MDELDVADIQIQNATSEAMYQNQAALAAFIPGTAGECDKCGEDRPRLVNGWCCFCRDKYENKRFIKCDD